MKPHGPLAEVGFEDYPQVLSGFLNAGGSPEELAASLLLRELNYNGEPVIVSDVTGDGQQDVLVNVLNPAYPPSGVLLAYTCAGGEYQLTYSQLSPPNYHTPTVLLIQDLNADGLVELIVNSRSCGAHTCIEDIRILAWDGEGFQSLLADSTEELPYPKVQITDYNQDGVYSLEVTGTAVGSVGAGPQRELTYTYDYDPADGTWKFASRADGPSSFRIHVVHDADAAMKRGEYEIASLLLEQVITDAALQEPGLLDWLNPVLERQVLSAYSYYKRVVAEILLGNQAQAEALLVAMHETYDETAQVPFVEMAEVFSFAYLAGGMEAACDAAHAFAAENKPVILDPLGPSVYGYANPEYTPEDVCP